MADPTPGARMAIGAVERHAARAGAEIAAAGGNVVDAVIAAGFAQGVVNPVRAGIGGGGVLMTWDAATKKASFLDFIGVAPLAARPDMFTPRDRFGTVHRVVGDHNRYGYLASLVPGLVRGLDHAHRTMGSGRVSWSALLEPAITLADKGYRAFPQMAEGWQDIGDQGGLGSLSSSVAWSQESRRVLRRPDGGRIGVGELVCQPDYASSLRRVAEYGADDFYRGRLAEQIVADFAAHGGVLSAQDLDSFEPYVDQPIRGSFGELTLLTQAPPSVGPTFLELLGLMDGWYPESADCDERYLARLAAAMRLAFTDRTTKIGDPRYVHVPLETLLSGEYLAEQRRIIDRQIADGTDAPSPAAGVAPDHDTTHVTAVDSDGNAALLTHSIGRGSGVITPGLGFMHNSHMNMFDPRPDSANNIGPGKRPNSGGAPVLGLHGDDLTLTLGSPAGGRKATAMTQILMNHFRMGMSLADSVDAPRLHIEDSPPTLEIEDGLHPELAVALGARGYQLVQYRHHARVIAITRDRETGRLDGASDRRGDRGLEWV